MNITEALKTLREEAFTSDLSTASKSALSTVKQIRDLENEITAIKREAESTKKQKLADDSELQGLRQELDTLNHDIRVLRDKYEQWGRFGDETELLGYDEEQRAELEPKVLEMESRVKEIRDRISDIFKKAEEETAVDTSEKEKELLDKRAELDAGLQDLVEKAKPEVDAILDILNTSSEHYVVDKYSIEDDCLKVSISTSVKEEATDDDFDWSDDDFPFIGEDRMREEFTEEHCPEAIAEAADWGEDEDGNYVLPFGGWFLDPQPDVDVVGEPSIENFVCDEPTAYDPGGCDYDIENPEVEVISYFYFYKPLSEIKDSEESADIKEAFFEENYGKKAWMLNQILSHLNDETAYFSGWLYIWPDGESYDECLVDFKDKDDYDELESLFKRLYSDPEFHEGGLYKMRDSDVSSEEWRKIVDAAHEWDKKLGLEPIKDLTKSV